MTWARAIRRARRSSKISSSPSISQTSCLASIRECYKQMFALSIDRIKSPGIAPCSASFLHQEIAPRILAPGRGLGRGGADANSRAVRPGRGTGLELPAGGAKGAGSNPGRLLPRHRLLAQAWSEGSKRHTSKAPTWGAPSTPAPLQLRVPASLESPLGSVRLHLRRATAALPAPPLFVARAACSTRA